MPKRTSAEETIVEFFNTAELGKVETLFNVVKGIIKTRTVSTKPAVAKTAVLRKTRTAVTTTVAASGTPVQEEAA